MPRLTESTHVAIRLGVVGAGALATIAWFHARIDVIEKSNPVRDEQREAIREEVKTTHEVLEIVREDLSEVKGDVREIRAILENRMAETHGR